MTAAISRQAPIAQQVGLNSTFVRRALGRREARRLAELMDDAELQAKARLDLARMEAEQIFAHARAEAKAILSRLPDFAAIEAVPTKRIPGRGHRSALAIIRDAADRHGIALAAVVGTSRNPKAVDAREEAVRGIAEANPALSQEAIGKLFGMGRETVAGMIRRGGK